MRPFIYLVVSLGFLCTMGTPHSFSNDDWPNWRGPHANGSAPAGTFPLFWNRDLNVAWRVSLPGRGGSTPAVKGDRIILTSEDGQRNLVLALDRNGNELWRRHVGEVRPGKHRKGTGSNPSPVISENEVVVYFKSGDLAAFDLDGELLWRHNLQEMFAPDTLWWDLGTSPVLAEHLVIVACLQSNDSYLAAFERQTGKLAWKQDRNLPAPNEANHSYTTPVLTQDVGLDAGGHRLLIVSGADHVTAHQVRDGREVWRVGGLNPDQNQFFRSIASPVVVRERILVPYARGRTLTAIRLGGRGDVTHTHVAWVREDVSSDVPTPAVRGDTAYLCSDRGEIEALRVEDGKTLWKRALPRSRSDFSASPIVTAGQLYATREDGTTFVVDLQTPNEIVSENPLDEMTVATPVFTDGQILLRTFSSLFCISGDRSPGEVDRP